MVEKHILTFFCWYFGQNGGKYMFRDHWPKFRDFVMPKMAVITWNRDHVISRCKHYIISIQAIVSEIYYVSNHWNFISNNWKPLYRSVPESKISCIEPDIMPHKRLCSTVQICDAKIHYANNFFTHSIFYRQRKTSFKLTFCPCRKIG